VLTAAAFDHMTARATRFAAGVNAAIDAAGLPWSVVQLGARAEYRFDSPPPRTGSESAAAADPELDVFLHVYMANRGLLITPFHNMALMCPETTDDDVDRHTRAFSAATEDLLAPS
jgi:glutamate-1-semialdehyde 2,1-aminomutase